MPALDEMTLGRVVVGLVVGVLLVTAGHVLSHAMARWAVTLGVVDLAGAGYLPRFFAWAIPGLVTAAVLWALFRNRALLPAVAAAAMVPVLYLVTFLKFFGAQRGLALAAPYWFETLVVALAVPGTILLIQRMHRPTEAQP